MKKIYEEKRYFKQDKLEHKLIYGLKEKEGQKAIDVYLVKDFKGFEDENL